MDTEGMNPERAAMLGQPAADDSDSPCVVAAGWSPPRSGANRTVLSSSRGFYDYASDDLNQPLTAVGNTAPPVTPDHLSLREFLRVRPLRIRMSTNEGLKMMLGTISGVNLIMNEIVRVRSRLPVLRLPLYEDLEPPLGLLDPGVFHAVNGNLLEDVWSSMSTATKDRIADQLRGLVQQIRMVPQSVSNPGLPRLGSLFDGDKALVIDQREMGKFWDTCTMPAQSDFIGFVMANNLGSHCPPIIADRLAAQLRRPARVVFCHGALGPRNIIVERDEVVAIIGWEGAGWYPEWWEYVKAYDSDTNIGPENDDWYDYIDKIFGTPYDEEWDAYTAAMRWRDA